MNERREYLEELSEQFNVNLDIVEALSDLLGEEEDYDGLIRALEDFE